MSKKCPNLLITIGAAVRDSYVVLKDSRIFISSHTAMLSVDSYAMSSSRSAVLSCETERGKRHVYIAKVPPRHQRQNFRSCSQTMLVLAYICCGESEELMLCCKSVVEV
jgi:hypothetical protein